VTSHLQIPAGTSTAELVDRRSRFIGRAQPLASPALVRDLVHAEREAHKGCTHVVHAFITGDVKSQVQGSSDDGEPKGTAGRPVLEVLKGSGFTNVLLTVVPP
jgi:putative IMPACT (imprinted ancient) family translation regulator